MSRRWRWPRAVGRTRSRSSMRRLLLLVGLAAVTGIGLALGALLGELAPGERGGWWLLATGFVAVAVPLTQPGLERIADRVAYGPAGDPFAVMNDFVRRASEALAIDDVLPQLAQTASRAVGSHHGEVELRLADGGAWRQSWPPAYPEDPQDDPGRAPLSVPLQHGGIALGQLSIDQPDRDLGRQERDLLERLAGPAGVAVSNVRLTVELRRQLAQTSALAEQLRWSRDRLVAARGVQRQQFTADVTDRVLIHWQQVDAALAADPCGKTELEGAREAASTTLASLRTLAHGVFPPALLGSGLPAALDQFLDETNLPVTVQSEPFGSATPAEILLFFALTALLPPMASAGPISISLRRSTQRWDGADTEQVSVVEALIQGPEQPPARTELYVRDRLEARDGSMAVQRTDDVGVGPRTRVTLAVPDRTPA
jgi:hypothetical protein